MAVAKPVYLLEARENMKECCVGIASECPVHEQLIKQTSLRQRHDEPRRICIKVMLVDGDNVIMLDCALVLHLAFEARAHLLRIEVRRNC